MNEKYYVGQQATEFESYDELGPITGISLSVDEETEYSAGTSNGYVLEVNCPYGTQEMANDILNRVKGQTYKGYRGAGAILSPLAELGDGITINGIYSMLAFRNVQLGGAHSSEISAPGENVLDHEYPYITGTDRKIKRANSSVEKKVYDDMQAAINDATAQITGGKHGSVVFHYDEYGRFYEILILDTYDINTAKNVWRWNSGGFGHSSNGYGGPYDTAITQEGAIVADFITTGSLVANIIKTGILQSSDGKTYFNLDTSEIKCFGEKTFYASDYTEEDHVRAREISIGLITPTAADYEKLDVNCDGRISLADRVVIGRMVNGHWNSYKKAWEVTISPNKRDGILSVSVTTETDANDPDNRVNNTENVFNVTAGTVEMSNINGDSPHLAVERGASGIWRYIKYADGWAECWGEYPFSNVDLTKHNMGGIYYSDVILVEYPFEFFETPVLQANGGSTNVMNWIRTQSSTSNHARFWILTGESNRTNASGTAYLYAIGQW